MIISLCLNPSFDMSVYVNELNVGETNMYNSKNIIAGGKGINVSNMLACLGCDVTSINLLGIKDHKNFEQILLNKDIIDYINILHDGSIRTNIKIISNGVTTEVNEKSSAFGFGDIEVIAKVLNKNLGKNDILVLSGSVPNGIPENVYEIIINKFKSNKIFVDTSGIQLQSAIKASPYCIKPNISELEKIINKELNTEKDIIETVKDIKNQHSISYVLLSDGKNGAYLFTPNSTYKSKSLNVPVKTTVGAGDTMLAGFIYGLQRGDDRYAFKNAIASCSAYISTHSFNHKTKNIYNSLINNIDIVDVDQNTLNKNY